MPSSPLHFVLRGLSVSQIQKCIPKQGKKSAKAVVVQSNNPAGETDASNNVSMIDNLFNSLRDLARKGHLLKAFETFSLIKLHASSANHDVILHSISSLLYSCTNLKSLPQGKQIHAHTISLGFENHLVLVPKLVTFYSSFSLLADAHIITVNSNIVNPLPWNLLISSYVNNGLHGEALSAYREMVHKGVRPDDFTYPSVLKACGEKLDLDFGREMRRCGIDLDPVAMIIGLGACSNIGAIKLGTVIHASAIRSCFDGFDNVRNALITMYSRCKDLRHAGILFKSIKTKRLTTWNSMLSGYTRMDRSEEASFLFREMLFSGIEPNYVTIASILPHCARVANLQRGKEFHCYILRREEFDDHLLLWNSLVEMYARSGKVLAAKRVFDSLGRRDELAEVRTYMRDLGVRKAPGCTWVDVGTGFSPFVVGDTSKDNSNDLYILLEGLTDLMKDAGYVAGENFSSEDEVLEEIECCNM
ncbi:hypothetical protein OIU77_006364 [Salix suchowensis]|uniref:Pentatricopeptide repeat-containing protein n=1 Tax=Salix suchowensis TaxID=1278906 RepID=A0ABQ9ALL1_9ROSI|nr:hypothetical protein OIU77_006364 [Salix suchowensis]